MPEKRVTVIARIKAEAGMEEKVKGSSCPLSRLRAELRGIDSTEHGGQCGL